MPFDIVGHLFTIIRPPNCFRAEICSEYATIFAEFIVLITIQF